MNRREEGKALTREKILTATRELVSERGFAAVTTADVAKAAGISHGAVFVHFKTRDALIEAVVEDYEAKTGERLLEEMRRGSDLKALLKAHLATIRADEPFYAALVRERTLLPQPAQDVFIAMQSAISHLIELRLGNGKARHTTNHALLFNTWIALVHYYLGQRDLFVKEGESVIDRHGAKLVKHFLSIVKNQNPETI